MEDPGTLGGSLLESPRRVSGSYPGAQYDASAQETIAIGTRFTFREPRTNERRIGYYHRDSARFTLTDIEGFIRSHFRTDEGHVADLPGSSYRD